MSKISCEEYVEPRHLYDYGGTITAGSSLTINIADSSRIILYIMGANTNRCGQYFVVSSSTGVVSTQAVYAVADSSLSITTSTNKIILSNSAAYSFVVYGVVFTGSMS